MQKSDQYSLQWTWAYVLSALWSGIVTGALLSLYLAQFSITLAWILHMIVLILLLRCFFLFVKSKPGAPCLRWPGFFLMGINGGLFLYPGTLLKVAGMLLITLVVISAIYVWGRRQASDQ